MNQVHFILFGPPGCGKDTQAKLLVKTLDLIELSTGQLLRNEVNTNGIHTAVAQESLSSGTLVDDHIMIEMVEAFLNAHTDSKGILYNGFPRTVPQAIALDAMLGKRGEYISRLISVDVERNELIKRLLKRGETSGRPDDANEDVIAHRLDEFNTKTHPVCSYYQRVQKVKVVNGNNPIEEIQEEIVKTVSFFLSEENIM